MEALEEIIRRECPPRHPLPTGAIPQLNRLDGIKAVLFDVYGTLFVSGSGDVGTAAATDSAEALSQALAAARFEGDLEQAGLVGKDLLKAEIVEWHAAAREAGVDFPEVDIAEVWRKTIALLRKSGLLKPPGIDIEPIRNLALEYECRVNPVYPMPGCLETLRQLQARGLVLGIVSNAQFHTPLLFTAFLGQTVEELGFDPDCCIWSYRELMAKPSAELFPKAGRHLARKHGISLAETAYVGNDMLNDIYCASRAGCKTVLFAGDQRSLRLRETDARCAGLAPDAVITSLAQLADLIRRRP